MPIADIRPISIPTVPARDLSTFQVSVGAGQVDQSAQLQSAFDSGDPLSVSAANGPVTLYISSPLTISKSGFYLVGPSGPNLVNPLVTIKAIPGYTGDMVIIAPNCTDGVWDGVNVDGGGSGTIGTGASTCLKGIGTNAGTRWIFRRSRFLNAQNHWMWNQITAVAATGAQTVTLTTPVPSAYLGVGTVIGITDSGRDVSHGAGNNHEWVTVTAVTTVGSNVTQFTATFAATHPANVAIAITGAPTGAAALFQGNIFSQHWESCFFYNSTIGLWGLGSQANAASYANNNFLDCHFDFNHYVTTGADILSAQLILGDQQTTASANVFQQCEFGRGIQNSTTNAVNIKLMNNPDVTFSDCFLEAGSFFGGADSASHDFHFYDAQQSSSTIAGFTGYTFPNGVPGAPSYAWGSGDPTQYTAIMQVTLANNWHNGNNKAAVIGVIDAQSGGCHWFVEEINRYGSGYLPGGAPGWSPINAGTAPTIDTPLWLSGDGNASQVQMDFVRDTNILRFHEIFPRASQAFTVAAAAYSGGVSFQNTKGRPIQLFIPIAATAAGRVAIPVGIGTATAPATTFTTTGNAASAGDVTVVDVTLPNGFWLLIGALTNGTAGTAQGYIV